MVFNKLKTEENVAQQFTISLENVVAEIFSKVYEYLRNDSRVIRPGSIRSYESGIKDSIMRLMFEQDIDYTKFREIVTRVGIENLILWGS